MSRTGVGALGLALLAVSRAASPAAPVAPSPRGPSVAAAPATITYDVTAGPQAAELRVQATFPPGLSDELTLDRAALAFVAEVAVAIGAGGGGAGADAGSPADADLWRPLSARGRVWSAAGCQVRGCRVRYRFRLADAAREIDDVDTAAVRAGVTVAPTTTWLLRPSGARTVGARFRLTTHAPSGWTFVSGLPRAAGGHEGTLADEPVAPYAAFGALSARSLTAGGGVVDVAVAAGVATGALLPWLQDAAQAIAAFYGRFPVPRLQVVVLPDGAHLQGKELGGGGASILLAPDDDPAHGRNDWVATHEMVHVATPELSREYLWMTEGLATYVEPIARVRAGQLGADAVWADMVRGMPKGLMNERDRGMNGTRDWGRLYWGGALFWLLADVEIRRSSDNRQSLETALRAVLDAGGNTTVAWSVEKFLDTGDGALARPVLHPLFRKMGMHPMPVDLPALWRKLGVAAAAGGGVTFDARAPLARVRAGITAPARP